MSKLWILLFKDDSWLRDDILHKLDDGRMTYTYRRELAEKIVKSLNEQNQVKNLFCKESSGENKKD